MLVVAVIVWRPQDAGIYPMKHWKPKYRSLGAPPPVSSYIQHDKDHWPAALAQSGLGPRLSGDGADAEMAMAVGKLWHHLSHLLRNYTLTNNFIIAKKANMVVSPGNCV